MRVLNILGLFGLLCALCAALPASASASCQVPTPAAAAHDDPPEDAEGFEVPGDAPDEVFVVTAPEITRVTGALDGACTIAFDTALALPPGETEPLVERESLRYYLDTDANPATGGAVTGAEWLVLVDGANGPDTTWLLRWNGAAFAEQRPVTASGTVGFSLALATIGVTRPTNMGVRVHSRLVTGGQQYVDIAPDRPLPQLLLPLQWTVPAPPAPPVPAPAASPAPVKFTPTCTVPALRGKTTAAARRAVKQANCKMKVVRRASRKVRRGRVIASTPGAGKRTVGAVTVIVSSGPPKAKRKRR